MRRLLIILTAILISTSVFAQKLPEIEITKEWKAKITEIAPAQPTALPKARRKALLFSLQTGFQHWVNPHTSEVVKILADKSKAFEVTASNDIEMFAPDKIREFDAIILNNTCSDREHRNIFRDVIFKDEKYKNLSEKQKLSKASFLEKSLIEYVANGGGLIGIHGAITTINSSKEFGELLGGSFDFHPKQQEVVIAAVDPSHPLVKAFEGKLFVHVDEPYLFNNAYEKKNFRPLLVMDTSKLDVPKNKKGKVISDIRYAAWIKKHGNGRVFYVSPAHNAQSFEDPRLLQFFLDGFQYALGDLKCDDSPMKR